MSTKKIAIVYHYIAHYRLPIFKELMKSSGIEYTLISGPESGSNIKTLDTGLAVKKIEDGGLRWQFVTNKWLVKDRFLWQKGLIGLFRKNNYDIVIFLGNIYYISTWVSILYLKLKRKNIYLWSHGVTSDEKGLKWFFRKIFYKLADGVLLYGHKAKNVMIKNGFPENNLHVIYNSLDYEEQVARRKLITADLIEHTKQELFKHPELPYIVFVGRLTKSKKLFMLVEASKQLFEKNIKINTLFVGEGDSKKELEQLINAYGLKEYFNFYGSCYEESELSKLIGSADICVSPGEVGLTAMTALGYGTPVISHDDFSQQGPEYEAIEPGINGDLFIRDSIEDLAFKIRKWLSINKDKPKSGIQQNCYHIIDTKYNPKNQVDIINRIVLQK